jgi:hypothetical protein
MLNRRIVTKFYWAVVAFILIVTVADAAVTLWSTFKEQVGNPGWRTIINAPAEWLLPEALMNGVMLLMVPIPQLTWGVLVAAMTALTLTPLALAGWFYFSRHKTLYWRTVALTALVAIGVVANLLFNLLWRLA